MWVFRPTAWAYTVCVLPVMCGLYTLLLLVVGQSLPLPLKSTVLYMRNGYSYTDQNQPSYYLVVALVDDPPVDHFVRFCCQLTKNKFGYLADDNFKKEEDLIHGKTLNVASCYRWQCCFCYSCTGCCLYALTDNLTWLTI